MMELESSLQLMIAPPSLAAFVGDAPVASLTPGSPFAIRVLALPDLPPVLVPELLLHLLHMPENKQGEGRKGNDHMSIKFYLKKIGW